MQHWNDFVSDQIRGGARPASDFPRPCIAVYENIEREYAALREGPAIVDRTYRGLLEVTGRDRASWLHNLVTNQVKPLAPGDGVYAFVLNVQGRILFDVNLLVMRDSIFLDLDRRFLPVAVKHFDKYRIVEDVQLIDRSEDFVRIGLAGEQAKELAAELGAPQAAKMPLLGMTSAQWAGASILLVRHDFCGPFGCELYVPPSAAVELWQALTSGSRQVGAIPAGADAVDVRRIEAGIPWSGREITDEYLPAETGQLGRAVSFNKGCYLGQEIVERMRARGALARRLVGIRWDAPAPPPGASCGEGKDSLCSSHVEFAPSGASLLDPAGKPIGAVTSSCRSPALNQPISLGYLKAASVDAGRQVRAEWNETSALGRVVELPFADGAPAH